MTRPLNELFEEDPLNLSDQDISTIVAAFREQRQRWIQEESSAKAAGRRANPKKAAMPPPPKGSLSLDDLGIDL